MLTRAQVDFYHKYGHVAVEDVLSIAEIEELRQVTDSFVEQSRAVTENTDVFGLETGHSPESPKVRRLKDPVKRHSVFDRTMRHEAIIGILLRPPLFEPTSSSRTTRPATSHRTPTSLGPAVRKRGFDSLRDSS